MAVNIIDRTGADALIPLEISREIIKETPQSSKLLPLMKRLPDMTAKQRVLPVQKTLPQAYFLNGDTGQKQTTNAEWDKIMLTAEELAVIVPIPEAVLDDSSYDIWAEIKPQIVESLGQKIDSAILFGTNKPASWAPAIVPTAISKGNNIALGTNADIASDIIGVDGVMYKVEDDGFRVNGFLADSTMEAHLRDLRDKNNNPIYVPALTANTPDMLVGRRIHYDNSGMFDLDEALMVAGDFTKAVYAIRQDVTYKLLTEAIIQNTDGSIAYNLAQQDMVALRVVMRLGVQVANPVTRRKGTEGYPFAVLQPKAVLKTATVGNGKVGEGKAA